MSIYKERPHWMSEGQWALEQENTERHRKATDRGVGILQLSARRYAVIRRDGTSMSSDNASNHWWGYVHYTLVATGLDWKQARKLARELWEEAEAKEAARGNQSL